MKTIQMRTRGGWRTLCTARGYAEEDGSYDAVEVYWALRHSRLGNDEGLRLVNEHGDVIEGPYDPDTEQAEGDGAFPRRKQADHDR